MINKIKSLLIQNMKAKDTLAVMVLRGIISDVNNKAIELKKEKDALTDEEIVSVLVKQKKQRQDSIQQFTDANRPELVEKEENELKIIEQFLPNELSEDEVKEAVAKQLKLEPIDNIQQMGVIMGKLKAQYGASIDMGLAGKIIKEHLA